MIKLIFRLFIYTGIWFVFECALRIEFNYKAEVWAALFIGFEAAFIGLTQLRNTRDTLEVELFMKFNERYSNLNELIKECFKKDLDSVNNYINIENSIKPKALKKALEDYINLCCEEYYCY